MSGKVPFVSYPVLMAGLLGVLLIGIALVTLVLPVQFAGGFWYVERQNPNPGSPAFYIVEDGKEKPVYRREREGGSPGQPPFFGIARGDYWLRPFGIHRSGLDGFFSYVTSYLTLVALGALLLFLFPGRVQVLLEGLEGDARQRLTLFLTGSVSACSIVVLTILLWLNQIWTPLLVLLLPLSMLAVLFGLVAVALQLGRGILGASTPRGAIQLAGSESALFGAAAVAAVPPVQATVTGLTVLYLISILPYAGWIFVGLAAVYGLGALIGTRFGSGEPWSLAELTI